MDRYTSYCTELQKLKAIELGAPISHETPTVEQMHGWLADQGLTKFRVDKKQQLKDIDDALDFLDTCNIIEV